MASYFASYSPEDVEVLIGGSVRVTGFSEDSLVTISKDTQRFTTKESSDGVVSRSHSNSRSYTVELVLHSASDFNTILTRLSEVDNITKYGKFPLLIKDNLGSTLVHSPEAWIEVLPDVEFTTEVEDSIWVIKCSQTEINIGGNGDRDRSLDERTFESLKRILI